MTSRHRGVRSVAAGGLVYAVSSVPLEELQRQLPRYEVVGKQSFLGSAVGLSYPIEVCAALDFGLATTAPLYLGDPNVSSFDVFADGERALHGRPPVTRFDSRAHCVNDDTPAPPATRR